MSMNHAAMIGLAFQIATKVEGWTLSDWANFGTIVASAAVIVGVLLGLRQLGSMSRSQRFQSTQEFYRLLDSSREDRLAIYRAMPVGPIVLTELDPKLKIAAENGINLLNKVAFMLQQNIVPRALVFRMGHTMFIRLSFLLGPFCDAMELDLGHRWGRRAIQLAARAQRFHQLNPLFRDAPVLVSRPSVGPIIAYAPPKVRGFRGWLTNRWRDLLWMLKLY